MHQQTDSAAAFNYQRGYQNPVAGDTEPLNPPSTAAYASAPPVVFQNYDSYGFPSDYSAFPTNPVPQPSYEYPFPHVQGTEHDLYHQNAVNNDYGIHANPNPEPSYGSQAHGFSSGPYHTNSFESNVNYDQGQYDGVIYRYNGGRVESSFEGKGGRSTDSGSGGGVMFDDYGRPINAPGVREQVGFGNYPPKFTKAVPKVIDSEDVKSGIQKFRVKLLSEGFGQTDLDVLCQVGLDGILVLDPGTSRTLKIYPLDTVTRWEVLDSYIFAFWAKTSIDPEPKRVRLKSNDYTTNNILDTVTAASIQYKEMGSSSSPTDLVKESEQSMEKRKAFLDWKNLIKPVNEEKDHWVPDEAATKCFSCGTDFSAFNRKHHCRNCGDIFCDKCTQGRIALTADEHAQPVRVCDSCLAEITQRLSNKVPPDGVAGLKSHENLARRLKVEMDKNRKTGKNESFNTMTREVECPTCTVHLQVRVPVSGSETIECSVCQHPFLVTAH